MSKTKKIFLACLASLLCLTAGAQEMLFPLHSNPAIKRYLQEHKNDTKKNARISSIGDTLHLPFIDDFAYDGIYPNYTLWSDNYVFVNRDYPVDPPTLGVATFDGLDPYGNPYNPGGTTADIADHLTSKYIDLPATDTTIWISFFCQPQGLGEQPDIGDSLMLEFINPHNDTIWDKVWSIAGKSNEAFKQVMVHVDTFYAKSGFRFRFTNIANLNGNVDHWHLDYVRLDKNRNSNDTAFTNEGAFLYRNKPLLAPPYTSMPYSHYKTNRSQFTVTSESVRYKNLTSAVVNFSHEFRVVKDDGVSIDYTTGVNAINVNPYTTAINNKTISYLLPSLPQSSLRYALWNINTIPDANPGNDTVKETQVLDNYYSYDDGTAEAAYGVLGASAGASLAYRFDLKMTDSLTGVQIYWNQVGPDVHNHLISITVWDQLTPNTNNAHIIYKLIDQKPINIDSINGFWTYIFDHPLVVSGAIYIGWIQDDIDLLNVGFDKNTDAHNNLYYNTLGVWQQSSIQGTVMIRPVFGSGINAGIKEGKQANSGAIVYPNPADKEFTVAGLQFTADKLTIELYNELGKIIMREQKTVNGKPETIIDVSHLKEGFYLLKVTDNETGQFFINKILIRH